MIELKLPLILASGSPRRKEILTTMGLPFTVDVSEVDETFVGDPQDAVQELSCRKAKAVAARHDDALILAADTLVCTDEAVLGKPGTPERAVEMLEELSGKWHSVYTGMTLLHPRSGRMIQRVCGTRVHFVEMTQAQIHAYVDSKEPIDKAGAYGIQGLGGMFVDRIEGCYFNVVGLPMSDVREMLEEMNRDLESGV